VNPEKESQEYLSVKEFVQEIRVTESIIREQLNNLEELARTNGVDITIRGVNLNYDQVFGLKDQVSTVDLDIDLGQGGYIAI